VICGAKVQLFCDICKSLWGKVESLSVIGYWILGIGKGGDKKKRARYHIELLTHYEKHYLLITQLLAQNTIYKYRAKA
jgi:hypothetical protein